MGAPSVIAFMLYYQSHRELFRARVDPRPPRWNLLLGRTVLLSGLSPLVVIGTADPVTNLGVLLVSTVGAIGAALWLFSQSEDHYDTAFVPLSRYKRTDDRQFSRASIYLLVGLFQITFSGAAIVVQRAMA